MLELAEAQCLIGKYVEADHTFQLLIEHARTAWDQAAVFELMSILYVYAGNYVRAVDSGLQGLRLFGIDVPINPSKATVSKELLLVNAKLLRIGRERLPSLPVMTDEHKRMALKLLINIGISAYRVDPNLIGLVMLKQVNMTLDHGLTEHSASIVCNYGMLLSSALEWTAAGSRFGELGLRLAEQHRNIHDRGRAKFIYASFIHPWSQSFGTAIPYYEESIRDCLQTGDLHLAGAASMFLVTTRYLHGEPLDLVLDTIETCMDMNGFFSVSLHTTYLRYFERCVRGLHDPACSPNELIHHLTEDGNELLKHIDKSELAFYYVLKLNILYVLGAHEEARQAVEQASRLMRPGFLLIVSPDYDFYCSLTAASFIRQPGVTKQQRAESVRELRPRLRRLRKAAGRSPANFKSKHLLALAEVARSRPRFNVRTCMELYEQSIASARTYGNRYMEALACELASYFYLSLSLEKAARAYMTDAIVLYESWGAANKARQLEVSYAGLLSLGIDLRERPKLAAPNTVGTSASIDLYGLMHASEAIAEELDLESLSAKLLQILLASAGAQLGWLFLEKRGKLHIKAYGDIMRTPNVTVQESPLVPSDEIPFGIVSYVSVTKDKVVLNHVDSDTHHRSDPYMMKHAPKSVLCVPFIHRGCLVGVLYTENRLTSDAFTEERVQALTWLSSQAAIALEHAVLYNQMEELIEERTDALERTNRSLEAKNEELSRMEQFRRMLLSNISHDLRTPITSIRGYVEALQEGVVADGEQQKKVLSIIHSKTVGLNRLINDLFELSKLETGQIEFRMSRTALDEVIDHILYKHGEFIREKRRFELDIKPALQPYVLLGNETEEPHESEPFTELAVSVDLDKLDQVLSNVIYNAIRYTSDDGEGLIRISFDLLDNLPSRDKSSEISRWLLVSVDDNGTGISEEDLPFIFDRYYSGSKSIRQPQGGGSGLGLAICREIIQLLGGYIWAQSQLHQGSTFSFALPVLEQEQAASE